MSESSAEQARLITLAADIVSAYVSNNHVQSSDLAKLLVDVHEAIRGVSTVPAPAVDTSPPKPAAQEIRRSVTPEYLISFEDGKSYKTLRRHLTLRGLTPDQYRAKWGLSPDYPMTSANYSEQRSELARALGLGQQRRKGLAKPAAAPSDEEAREDAPPDSQKGPGRGRRAARKAVEA